MNLPKLHGKHALITGANGGIGLAICREFLLQGAECTVFDLAPEQGNELIGLDSEFPNRLHYHSLDTTNLERVASCVKKSGSSHGVIDILVNNAALFDMAPLLQSDAQMYQRLFDVNVKGMFFTMQTVLQQLVDAGKPGSIINMASQAGRRGEALVSHYCATKAAVISYTQSAALAMAPHSIRVNAIAPGVIDTPMWGEVDSLFAKYENLKPGEKKQAVGKAVPLGRMGLPHDITGAAVFLASNDSEYITGQTLNVDGGNVLS